MVVVASRDHLTPSGIGGATALVNQRVAPLVRRVADLVSTTAVRHRRVLE